MKSDRLNFHDSSLHTVLEAREVRPRGIGESPTLFEKHAANGVPRPVHR